MNKYIKGPENCMQDARNRLIGSIISIMNTWLLLKYYINNPI